MCIYFALMGYHQGKFYGQDSFIEWMGSLSLMYLNCVMSLPVTP